MRDPYRILVWSDPAHEDLLRTIIRHPQLIIERAGAPTPEQGSRLASALSVPHAPDLRAALDQARTIDLLLLTSPDVLSRDERAALARFHGLVTTLEPRPIRFADLRDAPDDALLCTTVPQWSRLLEHAALAEALRQFGPVHAAALMRDAPAPCGTLRSLFMDAADLLIRLMGEPESVDAARSGTSPSSDTLLLTCGSLTAHLRFASGHAAVLACRAGAEGERLDAWFHGSAGTITLSRDHWRWSAPNGALLDDGPFPAAHMPAADRLAMELVERLSASGDSPSDHGALPVALLAAAEAARISIMTRSAEAIPPMVDLAGGDA